MSEVNGGSGSSQTLPLRIRSSTSPRKSKTPTASPISSPVLIDKWQYRQLFSDPAEKPPRNDCFAGREATGQLPCFYDKMQSLVQAMLNSETGVPIRSHRNKILSAVPSVFTGSDMINWLARRLHCSKSEATHIALLVYKHGYFYSVDKDELLIKEDSTLFRFQTPHLWPSQNFDDSDYTYSIFLLKQIKRSKNGKGGVALADYQLFSLRKLQSSFSQQWDEINSKANDEVRVLKEQRKIAKQLIICQERAFWRLRRPPPGEPRITDCFLTKFGVERDSKKHLPDEGEQALIREVELLKRMINTPTQKLSTSLEKITKNCKKYSNFDPLLKTPTHGNPWTTNDDSVWALERSLVEYPCESKLKKWACSLDDMLKDVTGRYNFEKFCSKQYCLENVRFWQAVQDLKMLPLLAVPGAVALIYDEFIDKSAQDMVNLSAEAFSEAENDLLNPSRYSFSLAQKEIYKLMETDIYPRFLNTDHEKLLKSATTSNSVGRSFLKKFMSRSSSTRSDISSPIEIASPCHPKRYTKRELSIGKKPGSGTGSVDNLFLATHKSSSQEASDLLRNLVSPFSSNETLNPPLTERRVSAPVIKYHATRSPSPNGVSGLIASTSKSPTQSDNSVSLSPLNEEEVQETYEDKMNENIDNVEVKNNKGDHRRSSNERAVRNSIMISRSMEDLSHLAEEEDGMAMAMHQDTFQMGLMSLRTPVDNFNLFDVPQLDRNKSDNTYDLYNNPESALSPAILSSFKKHHATAGTRPSIASLGTNMLTLVVPATAGFGQDLHSSNESIHSAISVS